jgi:hypothetical protein
MSRDFFLFPSCTIVEWDDGREYSPTVWARGKELKENGHGDASR